MPGNPLTKILPPLLGCTLLASALSSLTTQAATLRFLLPVAPYSSGSDREIGLLTEQFNREHPGTKVELLRRGENFSSLREFVALHLAGDVPDLAVIETSELPALRQMKIIKSLRLRELGQREALPFRRTVPVLFADQEMIFRVHADPDHLPARWNELTKLAQNLSGNPAKDPKWHSLALPLQGAMGLWIFEALAGKPLWHREEGGLRISRDLKPELESLQRLIDSPGMTQPEETWERAIQSFLDRKAPLLVGSLDLLPYVAQQATFRWSATPLPGLQGSPALILGGSDLVATRDSPEVAAYLDHLYAPKNAAKWTSQAGFLPLPGRKPGVASEAPGMAAYLKLLPKLKKTKPRTSDAEIIRAHAEWIQAAKLLLGESSRRLPAEHVMGQMDGHLNIRPY